MLLGEGDPAGGGAPSPVLQAHDVSVELGGLPVLRGVDLAVQPGEVVALLGGNGSGKSTLVRALLGLVPLSRGSVDLFGTPLRRFRSWRDVGYVPQRSAAAPGGAKVREVVGSGRLAHRRPFVPARAADRAAVARALAAVDLTDRARDDLAVLSGGQQQRVLIARALAAEPRLLVLDEPTAGVDLAHQEVLTAVLADLVAAGTAVLVVLHDVGSLGALVDRGVVLREGRVALDGPLASLGARLHPAAGGEHHEPEPVDPHWLDGTVIR
ncbi:zinc transport system ATP-binding protein [Friedmanniella luteola]|uniref:Zinc transport system ATP-binding protein n=1 Tax=Friedmanniella luteola TaxID=546871 RepID=A0A1H1X4T6_9ACTN|nr:ATP-binding cassette domain-containing protein [Friedmanniella luteola]SDT03589.1 zinc transport system ATP-binding protein [Friedmanniella luteola]